MTTHKHNVIFTRGDKRYPLVSYQYFSAAINFARLRFPILRTQRGFDGWRIERVTFERGDVVGRVVLAMSR